MDIMGLHGIVMESMKMTHVYATKIHDIFWDRMRLTAYIYMDVSPLWNTIKTMNSINEHCNGHIIKTKSHVFH